MKIIRKKRIYVPDGHLWWAKTHAMTPTIDILDDRLRVYFASLDEKMMGRIGYIDLDKNDPEKILHVAKEPILDIGIDGTFDDNGVAPSSIITRNDKKYLYYHGFQLLKKQVRFLILTGLAISEDGNIFKKTGTIPLLDRTNDDTFLRSLPHVTYENNIYKLWYTGVNEWTNVKGKVLPIANIRYLESPTPEGFSHLKGHYCLEPLPHEFALSRAFVFKHNGLHKMLISCRQRETDTYKLGYAESMDGKNWIRRDETLEVSPPSGEWDSDMICYTTLLSLNNRYYLFYNGNGFGATGFGYAEVKF